LAQWGRFGDEYHLLYYFPELLMMLVELREVLPKALDAPGGLKTGEFLESRIERGEASSLIENFGYFNDISAGSSAKL
jgi:hypothetical protein